MFFSSTIAFFIALTSPGPDTAIIINQCSRKGRAAGIFTAIGIGSGILIHCILAVTGISLLAVNYPPVKIFISLIGGAYIFYIGVSFFISESSKTELASSNASGNFFIGFITNIFNIKAFIFFISLFSILVESIEGVFFYIYPIYFALCTSIWFSFLSILLTSSKYNYLNIYDNFLVKIIVSTILCGIGLYIIFSSIYDYL